MKIVFKIFNTEKLPFKDILYNLTSLANLSPFPCQKFVVYETP